MNIKIVVVAVVVLAFLGVGYGLFQNKDGGTSTGTSKPPVQKKAPHFVSSTPAHDEVLSQAPTEVKIEFNFDVVSPSKITVKKSGQEISGATNFADDKLSIATTLTSTSSGTYEVSYSACWPDQSCHPGSFSFSVQ